MCFSAYSSLVSALIILIIGLLAIKKASPERDLYPFAALPIFFSIQQTFEGLTWLGFALNNDTYISYGSFGFLFFALIFWPSWIPFSLYRLESQEKHKQWLSWCLYMGILCSFSIFFLACCSFSASISNHHLAYMIPGFQAHPYLLFILYFVSTIAPFFIASNYQLWVFGLSLFFAFIASVAMFTGTILSIWCFFAILLSLYIYAITRNLAPTPQ